VRRSLQALLLAAAIGVGAGAPAAAAWGATSVPVHRAAVTSAPTAPQPGQGWLTGRKQRLLAVWVLLDVGAVLLWYGSDTVRPPRLLGSLGARQASLSSGPLEHEPIVGGIGRFARLRSGPPSRL